jgi:hypothetical protein
VFVVDNDNDLDIVDAPRYKFGRPNECQRVMRVDFLFGTNCSSKSKSIHIYWILQSRKTVRATLVPINYYMLRDVWNLVYESFDVIPHKQKRYQ